MTKYNNNQNTSKSHHLSSKIFIIHHLKQILKNHHLFSFTNNNEIQLSNNLNLINSSMNATQPQIIKEEIHFLFNKIQDSLIIINLK